MIIEYGPNKDYRKEKIGKFFNGLQLKISKNRNPMEKLATSTLKLNDIWTNKVKIWKTVMENDRYLFGKWLENSQYSLHSQRETQDNTKKRSSKNNYLFSSEFILLQQRNRHTSKIGPEIGRKRHILKIWRQHTAWFNWRSANNRNVDGVLQGTTRE